MCVIDVRIYKRDSNVNAHAVHSGVLALPRLAPPPAVVATKHVTCRNDARLDVCRRIVWQPVNCLLLEELVHEAVRMLKAVVAVLRQGHERHVRPEIMYIS